MDKKYFFLKLIPCRNDFALTMNDDEKSIMQKHVQYCQNYLDDKQIIVFGPVLDPAATYGVAIMAVTDESQVQEFIQNDPASALNKYEYFPMLAVAAQ